MNSSDMLRCTACCTLVPVVRRHGGKALASLVSAGLGFAAKSVEGKVIGVIAPLLVGVLVDEAANKVCGNCGCSL